MARQSGKPKVQNDCGWTRGVKGVKSSLAVRLYFNRIVLGLEQTPQSLLYREVIFNDENCLHCLPTLEAALKARAAHQT